MICLGNRAYKKVQRANRLIRRVLYLQLGCVIAAWRWLSRTTISIRTIFLRCEYCFQRGIHYAIEQPISSLLWTFHPLEVSKCFVFRVCIVGLLFQFASDLYHQFDFMSSFQAMFRRHGTLAISIPLGAYGSLSENLGCVDSYHGLFCLPMNDCTVLVQQLLMFTNQEEGHNLYNRQIFIGPRMQDGPLSEAWAMKQIIYLNISQPWPLNFMCSQLCAARERLARLRSNLDVQIVRKFVSKTTGKLEVVTWQEWVRYTNTHIITWVCCWVKLIFLLLQKLRREEKTYVQPLSIPLGWVSRLGMVHNQLTCKDLKCFVIMISMFVFQTECR